MLTEEKNHSVLLAKFVESATIYPRRGKDPTTPKGEDLFKSYKNKDAFMRYLGQFIDNAKKALEEPNQKIACSYWQKSLGNRFSCENAVNNITVNGGSAGLAAGAAGSRPWGKMIQ